MHITRDGSFTFEIGAKELATGLRPTPFMPRNRKFLVECSGAVGYEGVLQVLDDLNDVLLNTELLVADFPYPQIFVFTRVIIVCTATDIYELVNNVLVHQLNVPLGIRWSAVDFYNYVYLSNGMVSVERNALSGEYELSELPIASTICNFNGQVMVGAPDTEWL